MPTIEVRQEHIARARASCAHLSGSERRALLKVRVIREAAWPVFREIPWVISPPEDEARVGRFLEYVANAIEGTEFSPFAFWAEPKPTGSRSHFDPEQSALGRELEENAILSREANERFKADEARCPALRAVDMRRCRLFRGHEGDCSFDREPVGPSGGPAGPGMSNGLSLEEMRANLVEVQDAYARADAEVGNSVRKATPPTL